MLLSYLSLDEASEVVAVGGSFSLSPLSFSSSLGPSALSGNGSLSSEGLSSLESTNAFDITFLLFRLPSRLRFLSGSVALCLIKI